MGDWKQNASIVAVTAAVVAATVFTGGLATTLVGGAIGAGAVATGVGLTTAFLVGNVLSYLGGSVMNGKLLDPKEFACGNKEANAVECVSYQGGQLLTGAILTEGIGLVIPKGATTKVSNVTKSIDDLKKTVNYVDEVDEFGKVKVTDIDPDTGLKRVPCVSSLDNSNNLLDYALVIIGVRGLSVEAAGCDINQTSTPVNKNGYVEVNGFKFTEYYYKKLTSEGRQYPSLRAIEILNSDNVIIAPDPKGYKGVYKYTTQNSNGLKNWEMLYNPTTGEISHLAPTRD
jgi:hypothetical protein